MTAAAESRGSGDSATAVEQSHRLLVDARGLDGGGLSDTVDQLTDIPPDGLVLVIDTLDFRSVRRHGVPFEYVPSAQTVAERYGREAAQRVRAQRWDEILMSHEPSEVRRASRGPDGMVRIEPTSPGDAEAETPGEE